MSDRVPSDGGGKAREWTLRWEPEDPEQGVDEGFEVLEVDGPHHFTGRVVVVEKEWADRQLTEALNVIERAVQGQQMGARMEALLVKHGRLPR